MEYFSPERPLHPNGLPLYKTPAGWLAVIPHLAVCPVRTGLKVSVNLLTSQNEARWHSCVVSIPGALEGLLSAWQDNPEEVMRKYFAWQWRGEPPKPAPKLVLSLSELLG